jgi:hypothetical protein
MPAYIALLLLCTVLRISTMVSFPRVSAAAVCALLVLALCSTVVRAADIVVDDPDVTVLTDDNFEEFIQNDLALVEFYAPVSTRI